MFLDEYSTLDQYVQMTENTTTTPPLAGQWLNGSFPKQVKRKEIQIHILTFNSKAGILSAVPKLC